MTEDEVVRQHHPLNGHELEQTGRQWTTEKSGGLGSMGSQSRTLLSMHSSNIAFFSFTPLQTKSSTFFLHHVS